MYKLFMKVIDLLDHFGGFGVGYARVGCCVTVDLNASTPPLRLKWVEEKDCFVEEAEREQ
jgi:hypothetical protein